MRPTLIAILIAVLFCGCGTTKWSDTKRTATEQLLISDAMDRAVSQLKFEVISGKKVFLDSSFAKGTTDAAYLESSVRQHILASGCHLMDEKDAADYVVELRVGTVGTDRNDLLFGVPAVNVPVQMPVPAPTNIPEIPLAKRTEQRAVAKIAVFAYNRHTKRPIWQSGVIPCESKASDLWVLGAGPFQGGHIYDEPAFAGRKLKFPFALFKKKKDTTQNSVARSTIFPGSEREMEPAEEMLAKTDGDAEKKPAEKSPPEVPAKDQESAPSAAPGASKVLQATHTESIPPDRSSETAKPTALGPELEAKRIAPPEPPALPPNVEPKSD
jgi:hypothetical protein